ncbi:MAG TPA: hypothetical protein PLO59_09300, partial [Bacteroidia bacterium]|nr:hypothetical protein [Bacteroidia bacterium]
KIKSGTFKVTRTKTVASLPPQVYTSTIEFDASSISTDSVVRHLISIGDSEQVYYFKDTLYHLYHKSKQCFVKPVDAINFIKAIGTERAFVFMPYVSKSTNRFYNDGNWMPEKLNQMYCSEVLYDSLYSYLRFYLTKRTDNTASGFAIDMKLNASLSQLVSCTYTNIDNYFTNSTTIAVTPLTEGLRQLNAFDISYYLQHYKVDIIMPDSYFKKM